MPHKTHLYARLAKAGMYEIDYDWAWEHDRAKNSLSQLTENPLSDNIIFIFYGYMY